MRTLRATGPTQHLIQGWVVVRLPAETGWNNFAEIRESMCDALHLCANGHHTGVVIDFTGTVLSDSSALVSLARTCTRAELMSCPMRVVIPTTSAQLRHILHTIGLSSVLPTYGNVRAAVSAAGPLSMKTDAAEMQRVLDALRLLRLTAGEPSSPYDAPRDTQPESAPGKTSKKAMGDIPEEVPGKQDLRLEVAEHSGNGPLCLRLVGVLTRESVRRVGDALTSLVDSSLHHLRVDTSATSGVRDVLPVLLGIRWRVAANSGCLHLPSPPEWLSRMVRREGLRRAFVPCASCDSLRSTNVTLDVDSRYLVLPEMIAEPGGVRLGAGLVIPGLAQLPPAPGGRLGVTSEGV